MHGECSKDSKTIGEILIYLGTNAKITFDGASVNRLLISDS